VVEPGLDRHEWETEFQALEESLRDAPAEALPELQGLVERMLEERGFPIDDPVADDGIDPELRAEFTAARDISRRVDAGEDVGPGDVASAINGLVALYEHLIVERSAP
jgi:hypothetical protein